MDQRQKLKGRPETGTDAVGITHDPPIIRTPVSL